MSANRAKNTKPELILRKALWSAGHRGYRLHYRVAIPRVRSPHVSKGNSTSRTSTSVRPDISFVSKKIAIFVHGCFWHRCLNCRCL